MAPHLGLDVHDDLYTFSYGRISGKRHDKPLPAKGAAAVGRGVQQLGGCFAQVGRRARRESEGDRTEFDGCG